jgi:hypothetical protein
MQTEIETTEATEKAEPRKLQKPAQEQQEMDREKLVTYTDESGGGGIVVITT